MKLLRNTAAALMLSGFALGASAQSAPPPYGMPISLEMAKKAMAAAEAEAKKNSWQVVVAIVDSGGNLVMLQRIDGAQTGSVAIAEGKAKTAVDFRRPSKALGDALAGGGAGLRVLSFPGVIPTDGGLPIVVDGKIIGGIGVSGVTSQQDEQIAKAGVDALTAKP